MAVVHRCKFCQGEMKKYQPSNPFCKRKECYGMRMRHAQEHTELVYGKVIDAKKIGRNSEYLEVIRAGGTRQSKAV